VGEAEKDHIDVAGPVEALRQGDKGIVPRHRVDVRETLAGAVFAGDPPDFEFGVTLDPLDKFAAGITGGACNACSLHDDCSK
jgi:hypothetical protein